jgi:hypothetical protein
MTKKVFISILSLAAFLSVNVAQWYSTRLVFQRLLDRSHLVLFSFLKAWHVKRKIMFMRFFRYALRHICVILERKLTGHRELHLWPPLYRTLYEVHFTDSVDPVEIRLIR